MAKTHLKLVAPATEKRTVTPRRPANGELRSREYLTEGEVEQLMEAAKGNRYGQRDGTMILVAYRHGYGPPSWQTFVGSGGLQYGHPSRSQGQERHA